MPTIMYLMKGHLAYACFPPVMGEFNTFLSHPFHFGMNLIVRKTFLSLSLNMPLSHFYLQLTLRFNDLKGLMSLVKGYFYLNIMTLKNER